MGGSPTYDYLNGLRKLTPIFRENLDKIWLNLCNFQRLSTRGGKSIGPWDHWSQKKF